MNEAKPNILCNCGTDLIHDISLPSSPTPHLHRTPQAPDASEIASIRETLSGAKSDLSQIDVEIAQIQAVLDCLQLKRDELYKFISEHEAFLAPIRFLPAEILAKIFVLCMPDWGTPSFKSQQPPLLFGKICIGWRNVAWSTQELWSSITVNPDGPRNDLSAMAWLSRARSAPLSIRLDASYYRNTSAKNMWPAIAQLMKYCDRWKHVEIRLPDYILQRLHPVRHRLPWLESLQLDKQNVQLRESLSLDIFEYAPRLRALHLDSGISGDVLKIPWNKLTALDAYFANVTECLETLRLVPNLVQCRMNCNGWDHHTGKSKLSSRMPILQFPHLVSLDVEIMGSLDDLVDHLEFTVLRGISIQFHGNTTDYIPLSQSFVSLLSRSSHTLRSLSIISSQMLPSSPPILTRCLRAAPSLTELLLSGVEGWFTADTLHQLTCRAASNNSATCLVPDLEMLHIGDMSIDARLLADMIESRWRVADGEHTVSVLKKVGLELYQLHDDQESESPGEGAIRSPINFDAGALVRLRKFRDEGMDISISGWGGGDGKNLL